MNMTRVSLYCAILLSWALVSPGAAQEYYPAPDPAYTPGYAAVPNGGYIPFDPFGTRVRIRTDIGDGVGYNAGYQTISAFLPFHLEPDLSLVFIDARGFVTNRGDFAANVGAGFRMYVPEADRVFGINAWYDDDNTGFADYNQFGFGVESLGRSLDFRANVYFPLNDDVRTMSESLTGDIFFINHNIGLGRTRLIESPLKGGDVEIGGALPLLGDYGIRSYYGVYYYEGEESKTTWGFRTRTEALVTEDLSLQVAVSRDDLFGTNVTGAVTLLLPDGKPRRIMSRQPTQERLYAQVERQYRIAINRHVVDDFVYALRAGGRGGSGGPVGTPIEVVHIDNTAGPGGDGSFENPFNTLPGITDPTVDLIFVNRGDGTSTGMDTGITLRNNQRLLGEGVAHTFTSQQGTFLLPGTSDTGLYPVITNINGNAVTLASNNEVSGFNIEAPLTNGIFANNITHFDLNHLNITDAGARGISLLNAAGIGDVTDVTVTGSTLEGIAVNNNGTAALDLLVEDVTANANRVGLALQANNSAIEALIADSSFMANTNNGIALASGNGEIDLTVDNVTSSGNGDHGIGAVLNNATLDLLVTDSSFEMNGDAGIDIDATGGSNVNALLTGNTFMMNGTDGFAIHADSGNVVLGVGGADAELGNLFVFNLATGVLLDLSGTAVATLDIRNNVFGPMGEGDVIRTGFDSDFIPANDDGSSPLTPIGFTANFFGQIFNDLYVNNNGNVTFNAPLPNFVPFDLLSTATPIIAPFFADVDTRLGNVVTFGQGTVNGRPAFGVNYIDVRHFDTAGSNQGLPTNSFQLVMIDRSDVSPGDFDFEFNYETIQWEAGEASGSDPFGLGGASARVGYSNGVNAQFELPGSGVNGAFLDNGPAATSLIQNSLNSPILGRYVFQARSGSIQQAGTGGDAIGVHMTGNSVLTSGVISDNSITGAGGNGINFNLSGNANAQNVVMNNNNIRSNGTTPDGSGINISLANTAQMATLISNNMLNNNAAAGILVDMMNTSMLELTASGNTISGNGSHGFGMTTNGAGTATINLLENAITDNGGDGVHYTIAGGTNVTTAVLDNAITDNDGHGIFASLTGNSVFNGDFTGNTVTGNGLQGFDLIADSSTFNVDIGGLGTDMQNDFSDNVGAGIAFTLNGTTTGSLNLVNNIIDNTVDDPDSTIYDGEGVNIRLMSGTAQLLNSTIDRNLIRNSADEGIYVAAGQNTVIENLRIGNTDGIAGNGNTITDSGTDGIHFLRSDDARIDNVVIAENVLSSNGDDGIELISRGSATDQADYTILRNQINENGNRGISLRGEGNGQVFTTITDNTINNNTSHGIQVTQSFNAVTDQRLVAGVWTMNTITNNGGNGIDLSGRHDVQIGLDGTDATTGRSLGNTIANNDGWGIQINSLGTSSITNNNINNNALGGVDINLASGVLALAMNNNTITDNRGDGVEVNATGTSELHLSMLGNTITFNDGRGIDILNQVDAVSNIQIGNGTAAGSNSISSNLLEGVYLVNTASATQNQTDSSTTALAADGSLFTSPDVIFNMDTNTILGNGSSSGFTGTGLVIRVGTSNSNSPTFGTATGLNGNGRVNARVVNNEFLGNNGTDVFIHSFTSTVNPPISTATVFEFDPLARLNLLFRGNTGESMALTNAGASYNTADTFKSPLPTTAPAQGGPGPFSSTSRLRNAQRVRGGIDDPFRNPDEPVNDGITSGALDGYEGTGLSTFRIDITSETTGFDFGTGFITDTYNLLPSPDVLNPNGVFSGFLTGELPWGWGTVDPGTFAFPTPMAP